MDNLILNCKPDVKTMSSLEIAALTGKNHADVLRDVRKMLLELEIDESRFAGVYLGGNGEQRKLFNLDREHTDCLLTGYSAKARMLVIKRWHELEAQQAPAFAIPSTLSGALMLAAQQAEQIEAQQAALALAAPKVAFVEKYMESTAGSRGFREVCKLLEVKEPLLREFMRAQGIMYRLAGKWVPSAPHLDAGRFEIKEGVNSGTGHAFSQALFTSKGVEWIAGVWARHCVKQVCGVAA
jgi:phage antirepressor YoqD-like protein